MLPFKKWVIIMNEGKRVLIIEDDQEISRLLSVIMAKSHMEPVRFEKVGVFILDCLYPDREVNHI